MRTTTTLHPVKTWIPLLLICAASLAAAGCASGPQPGLYADKYVKTVSTASDWLVHPEDGPEVRKTDDMDSVARQMRDQGYVMIGYSIFNTVEAEKPEVDHAQYDMQRALYEATTTDPELLERQVRNVELQRAMAQARAGGEPFVGDPYDAGVWANAHVVYYQAGYAFSRVESEQRRVLADEVRSRESTEGGSDYQAERRLDSTTDRTTTFDSERDLAGGYEESEWDVGGSVSKKGLKVGGGYGETAGSYGESETYGSEERSTERHAERERARASNRYYESVKYDSTHWAMRSIDTTVDHYAYAATFWKKVDPRKVVLGAATEAVPEELWPDTGTRHGRLVTAVWGGTPAYRDEIWEGDVLLAIEDEAIVGESGLRELLARHQGNEVAFTIWRDGRIFDRTVRLQRTGRGSALP